MAELAREGKLCAEYATGQRNIIGAERVHAEVSQAFHLRGVVHGPRDNPAALCVRLGHEVCVHVGPLSPQIASANGEQGVQSIYRVTHLQHTAGQMRSQVTRRGDLSVIKGVDRATQVGIYQRLDGPGRRTGSLQLSVRHQSEVPVQRQCLFERRHRRWYLLAGWERVVMHAEDAVRVQVHVKLAAAGAEVGGPTKSGKRVLWLLAGGAAVGDDLGTRHGDSLTSVRLRRLTLRECQ